jgi:carbon monoxide dehydrogenase subunit G
MKLEQSFEVAAPLERVWRTLVDVEHVAPCLPGAAVTGRNDDGSYNGTFTVKIGPTTASYTGRLEMESIDEASHTATMQAQGTDKRGQGGAKATIFSRLAPADGAGTRVEVVTDYHITGRLARFGRGGMIEDISERLLREFAKRLQSSLAAQQDTIVSEPAVSEEPEAPADEEPPQSRDDTIFASAPTGSAAPEAPVVPGGEVTPPPPPPPSPGPPPVATPPPAPAAAAASPPPDAVGRPPLEFPPEPSEPIQGLSLVGGVMWDRVKRNPAPVAAAAGVAVVLLLARLRRRRH